MVSVAKPRPGSRTHMLLALEPGERHFIECKGKPLHRMMGMLSADFQRIAEHARFTQSLVIGICPKTREVIDLIMIERQPE